MDHTMLSESSKVLVVCLKYYNPPSVKTAAESRLGTSRYEIQVDYQSMNNSASEFKANNRKQV